jgi:hypothetical protein
VETARLAGVGGEAGRAGWSLRADPAAGGLQPDDAVLAAGEQAARGVPASSRRVDQSAPPGELSLPQQAAVAAGVGARAVGVGGAQRGLPVVPAAVGAGNGGDRAHPVCS